MKTCPDARRCRNLCHCLNELSGRILAEETDELIKSCDAVRGTVPPSHWTSFVFALRASEEELTQFQLGNYAVKSAQIVK